MVTGVLVIILCVLPTPIKAMKCFYETASMSEFSEIVLIKSEKSVT